MIARRKTACRGSNRQRRALHGEGYAHLRPATRPAPLLHAGEEPQINGLSEAFVNTLKRDYVRVTPLLDAKTALGLIDGWFEDYKENHPHSELKWCSSHELIAAQTAIA